MPILKKIISYQLSLYSDAFGILKVKKFQFYTNELHFKIAFFGLPQTDIKIIGK